MKHPTERLQPWGAGPGQGGGGDVGSGQRGGTQGAGMVLRNALLAASGSGRLRAAVERSAAARSMVRRFIAGEEADDARSEEHTSELQSREKLVCRLLLEKKN